MCQSSVANIPNNVYLILRPMYVELPRIGSNIVIVVVLAMVHELLKCRIYFKSFIAKRVKRHFWNL